LNRYIITLLLKYVNTFTPVVPQYKKPLQVRPKRFFGGQTIRKPGSVLADHLSRSAVASRFKRLTDAPRTEQPILRHISLQ